jgi:hypothetical protein
MDIDYIINMERTAKVSVVALHFISISKARNNFEHDCQEYILPYLFW